MRKIKYEYEMRWCVVGLLNAFWLVFFPLSRSLVSLVDIIIVDVVALKGTNVGVFDHWIDTWCRTVTLFDVGTVRTGTVPYQ